MKGKISGLIIGIALVSTMISPIISRAVVSFGDEDLHLTAYANISPSKDFYDATAYTENEYFGQARVAVSLFAYTSSGSLLDYDGVNYHTGRANAAVTGGNSVHKYTSYHGLYDMDYNYITSISDERP